MKGLRFIWHMEITEKMLTTCSCTCFADLDGCVHKVRPLGTFLSLFLCGTKAPPMVFIGWNSVQHSCDKTSMGWVDVGRARAPVSSVSRATSSGWEWCSWGPQKLVHCPLPSLASCSSPAPPPGLVETCSHFGLFIESERTQRSLRRAAHSVAG